jgi:hypothetical protein
MFAHDVDGFNAGAWSLEDHQPSPEGACSLGILDVVISGTTAEVGALLTAQGWVRVPADASAPLDELAKRIVGSNAVRAKVGDLTPRERADAQAFSLSGRFGLGAFDAHTDGAADPLPPRWCFMRLAARSKTRTPTLLWDLRSLELPAERLDALRRGTCAE